MKILVTGGAGFIGSFLVDELIRQGHQVRIYDNLSPQVHGPRQSPPAYLNKDAEFINKDILDRDSLYKALKDVDVLFHLAAMVGVAQSMYQVYDYVQVNTLGTALIQDIIANEKHKIKKMLVASSMTMYSEGRYECGDCGIVCPPLRPYEQLKDKDWFMHCPKCSKKLRPIATDETKPLNPRSVYSITKKDQEELFLSVGRTYDIPATALRFFNVYGPRQALSNPYTGVCAIFSSRILNNHNPVLYEDGLQTRDFIHVKDVVRAAILAMESKEADYGVFNVGSGRPIEILKIAEILIDRLKANETITPELKGHFRKGDIRHCFADTTRIKKALGFEPEIAFEDGIDDLTAWVKKQSCEDKVDIAIKELEDKGLAE
ncbi:MAG: GDP-mannose 4,6-dehydratase [Candidatus Omnitrophica bacterium]|nr:GDP-mannose 4,6-dehydratase [Candidatus Omnitrophota bacterium]